MQEIKLTIKQEKFCQEYIKHGDKTRAYKASYNSQSTNPETFSRLAQKVFNHVQVSSRIRQLKEKTEKIFIHTLFDSLKLDMDLIEKYNKQLEVLENKRATKKDIEVAKRTMQHIGNRAYNGAMERIAKKQGFYEKDNRQKETVAVNISVTPGEVKDISKALEDDV